MKKTPVAVVVSAPPTVCPYLFGRVKPRKPLTFSMADVRLSAHQVSQDLLKEFKERRRLAVTQAADGSVVVLIPEGFSGMISCSSSPETGARAYMDGWASNLTYGVRRSAQLF